MPDTPQDTCTLQEFVYSVLAQMAGAFTDFERDFPSYLVGDTDLLPLVHLRPVTKDRKTVVYVDTDTGKGAELTRLPLPLRRRPKGPQNG